VGAAWVLLTALPAGAPAAGASPADPSADPAPAPAADTLAVDATADGSWTTAAVVGPTVTFQGHGWGHGRGLGQFGSLGYSLAGWDGNAILDHYYSNTVAGAIDPNGIMTVRLTDEDGTDTLVQQSAGTLTTNFPGAPGPFTAVKISSAGGGAFSLSYAATCAGPWATVPGTAPGPIVVDSPEEGDNPAAMAQVCEPDGTNRWYRGDIVTVWDSAGAGTQRTINTVRLDQYVRGVVPRESPASWANSGNGAGINALRAQAVAARSYGWSEGRYVYSGFGVKTCDTAACQVYAGYGVQLPGGPFTKLEDSRSDQAVAETAGVVRLMADGSVARTEFSSSTGGWTAGGTFTAVVDDGDATPSNPNHTWRADIPVTAIQTAFPTVGTVQSVRVATRNGLGDWGGRVTQVVVQGTAGTQSVTGASFQTRLSLKSDWFQPVNLASGGVGGYWMTDAKGGVYGFGSAATFGSMDGQTLNRPIVGMERSASGNGYWLVASDGGIFSFGDARFLGSTGAIALNKPIVGMERTASGNGYWLVASDGGIFSYGDATFYGSTGDIRLNQPIVGMERTPSGNGYWLVASDGGVFSFGDAAFAGSTGAIRLAQPIVGMGATPTGRGYWMVASDGGLFAFGDAGYLGSLPGSAISATAVGMEPTATGQGYLIASSTGVVYAFGDAPALGGIPDSLPSYPGGVRDIVALGDASAR
jgi:SpoIID/LytB domain protein